MRLTVNDIKKNVCNTNFSFYGIRVDSGIAYNVGDIANASHQLYQDPYYNEDCELIYPYIEDGIYAGFYDAGELGGTCTIGFDAEDDASIARALEQIKFYFGDYMHVLGGDYAEVGSDSGELIIANAEVLGVYDK